MKKTLCGIGLLINIICFSQTDAVRKKKFNVKNNIGLEGYDPISFLDKKPAEVTESTTAPEEAAKAEVKKFAVDKIESGKKWEEAGAYCEKLGAILPSRQEFADYSKEAALDLKTDDVYWTKNFANNTKAFAFNFKTGKSVTILKSEKHKVLCKN